MTTGALYALSWLLSIGTIVVILVKYRALYAATENISKAAFYDDLDARISLLERDRTELESSLSMLRETESQARLDTEAALRQKMSEERELETIRAEALRINEQIKQLEPEREELRRTREHLDRTRLELGDLQRKNSELMAALGKAEAEMASVIAKRDEAARDLRGHEERLPSIRAEVALLDSRVQELHSQHSRLQEEINALRQARESQEQQLRELEQRRIELEGKTAQLANALDERRKQLATTEATLDAKGKDLRDLKSELIKLQNEEDRLKKEIASSELRMKDLIEQRAQMQEEMNAVRQAKASMEKELRSMEQRRIELEGKNAQLANALAECRKELATTESALEAKGKDLLGLNSELTRLRKEEDRLKKEIASTEGRLKEISEKRSEMETELGGLKKEIQNGRRNLEELQEKAADCERQVKSATQTAEDLKAQIEGHQRLLDSLMKTAAQHGGYVEQPVAESLQDLKNPVNLAFASPATGQHRSESGALEVMQQKLADKGLYFHERVLRAFHTSLKTSDFNQLTVLAGVSGTGKSALPRAYAQAMGIHSLVVPVQPGWAGPQDLLGFFNYLERKYKATDLARYLAHFSRYAAKDLASLNFDQAGDRKEDMLLVLLDEMNLARVEYYFSEFLSRLETRQMIDPADEKQRRQVAIPLETGPVAVDVVRPVLYPDSNILFVGTMNEDESTQSLSDKVVDRANVLRFGAPKKFGRPIAAGQNRQTDTSTALPREVWEKWCNLNGHGMNGANRLSMFDKLIPDLSGTMEALGRPFGYRTHEAMRRYVLAYPALSPNPAETLAKWAMADQMEQKIIPKLRGIDTDERANELRRLESIIDQLSDELLLAAFKSAANRPIFEWTGLDRTQ